MSDLSKYTSTELLKMSNDIKTNYEILKKELVKHSLQFEELGKIINDKLVIFHEYENTYGKIMNEINSR